MDEKQRAKAENILYILESEACRNNLAEFFDAWGTDVEDWKNFKKTLVDHFQLDGTKLYIKI